MEEKIVKKARKVLVNELSQFPEILVHIGMVENIARKICRGKIPIFLILAIIFHDICNKPGIKNHSKESQKIACKWLKKTKANKQLTRKVLKTFSGQGKGGKILKSADAIANISSPANIPLLLFRSWKKLGIDGFREGVVEARRKLSEKSQEITCEISLKFKAKLKKDLEFLEKVIEFTNKGINI